MRTGAHRVKQQGSLKPLSKIFCLAAVRWADDAKACACVVWCLFRGGDAACFRAATAWRSVFYGKTLHSLRWQPETDECVSATGFVKMRVRILTSCKNRVKSSYKQKEGGKHSAGFTPCMYARNTTVRWKRCYVSMFAST